MEAINWRNSLDEKNGGTQFKLKLRYDNEMYAIAKPIR